MTDTAPIAAIAEFRSQLWKCGYRPVAVYSNDKRPVGNGWHERAQQDPPEAASATPEMSALNTGIICGGLRAVDIDVDDEVIAGEIHALCIALLGGAPVRFRSDSPRRLLLYRATEGKPPKRAAKGKYGKVEILGSGQQCVVAGIHPNGATFQWNPSDSLTAYHRDSLNSVSEKVIDTFLEAISTLLEPDVPAKQAVPSGQYNTTYLDKLVNGLAEMTDGTHRNSALFYAARCVGEGITAGLIDEKTAIEKIWQAASANGYVAKDGALVAWKTLQSGLKAGKRGLSGTSSIQAAFIQASPFEWMTPVDIPRRMWLYGKHYIMGFVSATVAPGAVGKSSLITAEAIAIAIGRNLLGYHPDLSVRVWYWNGEDPADEIRRKITATMLRHKVRYEELENRLFVNSGRDTEIIVAKTTRDGAVIQEPVVQAVEDAIITNDIGLLIIDPFITCHEVSENDNGAINQVVKIWRRIAEKTGCAIELVHHSRKTNGNETTIDDARGASSLTSAVRSARTLNLMSKSDAEKLQIDVPRSYVRVDEGKPNLALPEHAWWFKLESIALGNGLMGTDGDLVGVAVPWRWPQSTLHVSNEQMHALGEALAGNDWRYDPQAKEWIGYEFANVLCLHAKQHKRYLENLVKQLLNLGALELFTTRNKTRKECSYVRVKDWSKAPCSTSQGAVEQGSAVVPESAPPPPLFMGGGVVEDA